MIIDGKNIRGTAKNISISRLE